MDKEEIIKQFEEHNNLKIIKVTPLDPGKKGDGQWLQNVWRLDASDGRKYVFKYIHLRDERYKDYLRIQSMHLKVAPKLFFIRKIGDNHYAVVVEWVEGITLEEANRKNKLKYFFGIGKVVELIKKLHAVDADAGVVSIDEAVIDSILDRDFLDRDLKETLRKYLVERLGIVNGRRMTIVHGDMHSRNIMVTEEGLKFIDFDDARFGDAYIDLIYMANNLVPATTFDKIYKFFFLQKFFDGHVPEDLWEIVNFYSVIKNVFRMNDEINNKVDHRATDTFSIMFDEHKNMTVNKPDWYIKMEKIFLWTKLK